MNPRKIVIDRNSKKYFFKSNQEIVIYIIHHHLLSLNIYSKSNIAYYTIKIKNITKLTTLSKYK